MASTYSLPSSPGSHSHDQTHARQLANSKVPLRPPSFNSAHCYNEQSIRSNGFIHDSLEDHPPTAVEAFPKLDDHHTKASFLQLPKPSSFSTPTEDRSKSMERRKSAGLPTHLNLDRTGYGYQASTANKARLPETAINLASLTMVDILSAILMPLPFVMASLAFGLTLRPSASVQSIAAETRPIHVEENEIPGSITSSNISAHVALTGMTGLCLAIAGSSTKIFRFLRRQRDAGSILKILKQGLAVDVAIWHKIAARILSVGIPFYATYFLGGMRVATILLPALASGLSSNDGRHVTYVDWLRLLNSRKSLVTILVLQMLADFGGLTSDLSPVRLATGYTLMAASIVLYPPSYPFANVHVSNASESVSTAPGSQWQGAGKDDKQTIPRRAESSLLRTPEDVDLTIISAGTALTLTCMLLLLGSNSDSATSRWRPAWCGLASLLFALSLSFTTVHSLQKSRGLGTAIGLFIAYSLMAASNEHSWTILMYQSLLIGASWLALYFDIALARSSLLDSARNTTNYHRHTRSRPSEVPDASRFTNYLLPHVLDWPLLHTILVEKDSRRIFYFMCLNFAFMLVQTFYGIVSGSLGLLSDSIHMFFDCLALIVGLSAAVMSKWPPSTRFPYGYAKIETLAGFANGIFLMLISVEIIYEAIERLSEGSNVKRLNELMTVSILGFVINIVGVFAFGHAHHGHDHSHGHSYGHSHDHSHTHTHDHTHDHSHGHMHEHKHAAHCHDKGHGHKHDHDHASHHQDHRHGHGQDSHSVPEAPSSYTHLNGLANNDGLLSVPSPTPSMYASVPATPSKPPYLSEASGHSFASNGHGHKHQHAHGHHHSENMMGIYLHVLGDTLGSLAVVLSTWLVQWNGWSGWDPLASTGIAIIIFGTAIPLVTNCASKLLLTVPADVEYDLREALAGVSALRGVLGCTVPKFWVQDGDESQVMGVVHVVADKVSNLDDVKERCIAFLKNAGLDVLVHVEREGMSRCWCQASR